MSLRSVGMLYLLVGLSLFFYSPELKAYNPDSILVYKKLLQTQQAENQTKLSFDYCIRLADQYIFLYPDSSSYYARQALHKASLISDQLLEGIAYLHLSNSKFKEHRYEESLEHAVEARNLLQQGGSMSDRLMASFRTAEGLEFTDCSGEAMQIYQECYEQAEEQKLPLVLSQLDLKFGNLRQVGKEFMEASIYYKKAADRLDRSKKQESQMHFMALQEYYDLILKKQEYFSPVLINDVCQEIQKDLRYLSKSIPDIVLLADFKDLKIRCAFYNNDKSEIQKLTIPDLNSLKMTSSNQSKIQSRIIAYSQIALQQRDFQKAQKFANESWKIASVSSNYPLKISARNCQKEVAIARKRFPLAMELMGEVSRLEKDLFKEERINNIQMMESELERKEREKEILLLQKDRKNLNLRNRNYSILAITSLAFLSLLLISYIQISLKNRMISNQKQELENTNRTKDRILAILGHDLRKPAFGFRGLSKKINYLLNKEDYSTLQALGSSIESDALSLLKVTDNLINWVKIQKKIVPYFPQAFDVHSLFEEAEIVFQKEAQKKKILIVNKLDKDIIVKADFNSISTVVRNLVDNAIKFSSKGGKIELDAVDDGHEVIISVRDYGIGMNENELKKIFQLQQEKSQRGTIGERGFGLGLHLCSELLEINKGLIEVESKEGEGSVFRLRLPVS